jgi:hypothetical protein
VAAHVGDLPAPKDSDANESSGSKDSNDNLDNTSVIDNITLEEGNHLGNDDYLITRCRVLSGATHLVVNVIKSQDHNFTVGYKRIHLMARAFELYRQYNDLSYKYSYFNHGI